MTSPVIARRDPRQLTGSLHFDTAPRLVVYARRLVYVSRVEGSMGTQHVLSCSDISFRKGGRRVTFQTERLLDDTGWRILKALQADARLSFSELGRRVGLSAPAAAERVRRLEDAGIIAGYRVDLALEKLFPMTAIIRISAPEENCTRLAACARGLEEVVEAHRVTGSDRLVLKVVAQSVDHLDGIIRQLSQFGTATVSIVLSTRRQAVSHVRERGHQRLAAPQAAKGARR